MPFTPDPPFPKTQGDNVRSKDWNDALAEIIRLDSAKANRAGSDRFTGPLTIDGNVGIGTTTPRTEMLEVNGRVKAGPLTIGQWAADPACVFIGANTLDQTNPGNYALMQRASGGETGMTALNSPTNIRFRIANVDKMVLAANGNLVISGSFIAPQLFGNQGFRIASGRTAPGATNWQVYNANGISVNVDTSAAGFTKTPMYLTSLGGSSNHWAVVGASSIYVPTPTGFTVYVRYATDGPLAPATANALQWFIQWVGFEIG